MIEITDKICIPESEIEITAVRSQGAGGQNVNKVASAIHLRFSIQESSLPEMFRERLSGLRDRRITGDGVIIIKAQRFRTQEKNRTDAIERLIALLKKAMDVPKKRTPTKPTRASRSRRLDDKSRKSQLKTLRNKIEE